MKIVKYLTHSLIIITLIVSCKKSFLEVGDDMTLNKQGYVKDLNSMQEFMNGIYLLISSDFESASSTMYAELTSDNLKPTSISSPNVIHYNWSQVADGQTSTNSISMNETWKSYYLIIRSCNFVIEEADKYLSENSQKARSFKGQALSIRALVYFRLVNVFAHSYGYTPDASHLGVPYIETSDITASYTRQTVAQVYNNMIADLILASELMEDQVKDCRYMSGIAAKALLARIYLFKGDFNEAKKLSVNLTVQLPLMSIANGYPSALFTNKAPNQTEILFQATPDYGSFIGFAFGKSNFLYSATKDIATLLYQDTNDVRSSWIGDTSNNQFVINKFPKGVTGGANIFYPEADYYSPLIRSSEIFLIAAEASARLLDEVNAKKYLNAIRKRANPQISNIDASGMALIDSINTERRKELCFEGFRMFDLQRLKLEVRRTDFLSGYQNSLVYPSDKAISPIPNADVRLMGLQQNTRY